MSFRFRMNLAPAEDSGQSRRKRVEYYVSVFCRVTNLNHVF
jgi:hypothetical protein